MTSYLQYPRACAGTGVPAAPAAHHGRSRVRSYAAGLCLLLCVAALCLFGARPALAVNIANGHTQYTNNCSGCHGVTPGPGNGLWQIVNGASASGDTTVIDNAISHNWAAQMGSQSGVSSANRGDIAAYVNSVLPTVSRTIAYQGQVTIDVGNGGAGLQLIDTAADPNNAANFMFTGVSAANGARGTTSVSGTQITYTASALQSGADSFTWSGTGGIAGAGHLSQSISITIGPGALASSVTVARNSINNAVSLNTVGSITSVAVSTAASHGTATASGTSITYTPTAGYTGTDSFQYTVTGPNGTSVAASVSVGVTPTASNSSAAVAFGSSNNAIALSTAGALSSVAVSTAASHGTATASGTSITYTPTAGFSGTDSFQFTATGAGGTSAPATVTIGVTPSAGNSNASVVFNSSANLIALGTGGTLSSVAVSSAASHGTATASGTTIRYTPTVGYSGTDSFQFTATGTGGTSAPATVTIGVVPSTSASSATVSFGSSNNGIALTTAGTVSSVAVSSAASHGTATASGTSITYTPTAGFSGNDSFQFTATGPGGTSAATTVSVGIAPSASNSSATVIFGSSNNPITLTTGGALASVAISSAASHGTATASGTSISYSPTAGYSGTDSFQFTATGAGGTSAAATVSVAVVPSVSNSTANVAFGSSNNSIALTTGGTVSSVAVVGGQGPSHGTASASGAGITYTPTAGYSGADSFKFTATGPGGTSAQATVSLNVGPGASNSVSSVSFNSTNNAIPLTIIGSATSVSVVTGPTHGNVSVSGATITYTPTAGYFGPDSFVYTATGTGGTSGQATVSITVGLPGVPTVSGSSATVAFNSSNNSIPLTISGVATSVAVSTAAGHGTATASGTTITYTPTAGFSGADSFRFTATGPGGGPSAPATVNITVNPAAPTVSASSTTVVFGSSNNSVPLTITGSATSVAVSAPAGHGTATASGGAITYTPTAGFSGTDSFTFTATNAGGTSAPALVSIGVTPSASNSSANVAFGASNASIALSTGGTVASVSLVGGQGPSHGTASVSGASITYTPTAGYSGGDSLKYTATGSGGTSAQATVTITVGPGASASSATVAFGSSNNVIALSIIGSATSVAVVGGQGPSHGTATASGTSISYTPTAGYSGADSFKYTATGPGGTSPQTTVNITVGPGVANSSANVAFGSSNNAIALTTVGTVNSVAVSSPASHGTATASGTGITYAPAAGYSGLDSFQFTATGPGGTSSAGTVSITVGPGSSNSTAAVAFGSSNNALALTIIGTATSVALVGGQGPSHGTATASGTSISYTPAAGFSGSDSLKFTATGAGGTSAAATVTINVGPGANDSSVSVPLNATNFVIPLTLIGTATSVAVVGGQGPSHGTASVTGTTLKYTPSGGYTGADSLKYTATGTGGTSPQATVTISVVALPPVPGPYAITTLVNTPVTVDLLAVGAVTGSGITGVVIGANPAHGTVSTNGTSIRYTPSANFFGRDSFTYKAFGTLGLSATAAIVTVDVGGVRPNPLRDPSVVSLISTLGQTTQRFARAQIGNFSQRLEFLHSRGDAPSGAGSPAGGFGPGTAPVPARANPVAGATGAETGQAPAGAAGAAGGVAGPSQGPRLGTPAPAGAADDRLRGTPTGFGEAPRPGTFDPIPRLNAAPLASALIPPEALPREIELWTGGSFNLGSRSQTTDGTAFSFTTEGVSAGLDMRVNPKLRLGMGLGYGRDRTDIGTDGSAATGRSVSFALYGSYQPTRDTFIDALAGVGRLSYDTQRYVASVGDYAIANRTGQQFFGSVAAGYELKADGLLVSPYGRIDAGRAHLRSATEQGAGTSALAYSSQDLPSLQFTAGLRLESGHETSFGSARPRLRLEYHHEFEGQRAALVSYADQVGGPQYALEASTTKRNSLSIGIGSDFVLSSGLKLSADYQMNRSFGPENDHVVSFRLVKDFDGRGLAWAWPDLAGTPGRPLGILVDVGYAMDDNVNRGSAEEDRLADQVYTVNASKRWVFSLSDHSRLVVNGFASGEKFRNFSGLTRLFGGGQAELQYRAAAGFLPPTYALFVRSQIERFESDLRDGYRYSTGVSVRKPLTDRINFFSALAVNRRDARSQVFTTREYSGRFNFDWALSRDSTVYFGGEYRQGDVVSSGRPTLTTFDLAEVLVRDDVFTQRGFFDYRTRAKTTLSSLGYNLSLGERDSLDFSWRWALSTPTGKLGFASASVPHYVDNLFAVDYLVRF